ncbi:MAG: SIS domain-containing protein [Victivallales bacterium]|nr:SIS domain-containing protein [Victivallales bacterium]
MCRYPALQSCKCSIWDAYLALRECFASDHALFACGNGGSAADSDHIVGEIVKGFTKKRPLSVAEQKSFVENGEEGIVLADKLQQGFKAFNLMSQSAIWSAVANDLDSDMGAAQQLWAIGRSGDVLLGISTSGNARNVALAVQVARVRHIKVIGLTGQSGGRLAKMADVCICVPERETFKVQELHLPVYHALCMMVEHSFFAE